MKIRNQMKNRPWIWIIALIAGGFLFAQCEKEDLVTPLTGEDVTGEYVINTEDGSWRFDKSHSNVRWSTAYVGDQALLTGRFNSFSAEVNFDQADLENSSLYGWVVLSTFNTGEPGRDGLGKCGPRYLGVEHNGDTLINGALDPDGIIASTDSAFFESTEIVEYGDGYKAVCKFTFNGVESDVDFIFDYITEKNYAAEGDPPNIRASFTGEFDMSAKDKHGVSSSSIADLVTVSINSQFRKN